MAGVEDRAEGRDMVATVTLEVQPKRGVKRLRRFELKRKEGDGVTKLLNVFIAPTDVQGAAFLVWDRAGAPDLRWIYLPAIKQVRHLAAGDSRQSFFGSDFVYEDLTNRDPDLDVHALVGSQAVDGWDCWVVDSTPRDGDGLDFTRYRSWVWKEGQILVRQEYFDRAGKVVRRGQVKSLAKVQGIWTWHQGTMWNLRTGSESRIQISGVRYDTGLSDAMFAEAQLDRGAATATGRAGAR